MKSLPRWLVVCAIGVLSFVAVAGVAAAVYAAWLFHDMPDTSDIADYRPPTATRVYAWDGTLIGEFSRERRIFVPYDQIPPQLAEAFIAAEDHNFFNHAGVDPVGLSRAMLKNIINAIQGRRLEGGSTITQQVAKNVLLNSDQTMGRKLKEAILANQLEQILTKEQILELYLNEIWLGYRSYGVGAAAYNYFGKPISDLTLAECAYLAALPKGPQNYHPVRNKAAAIARRNAILAEMADLGYVTRAQAEAAMKEDLIVQTAPARARYRDADYFVEEVRRRAVATLGPQRGPEVYEGGFYMRTTLDPRLQTAARIALMNGLEAYDRRHGWRGAWGHVNIAQGWQAAAAAKGPPAERRTWRAAVITAAEGGAVSIELASGGTGTLVGGDVAWARAGRGLAVGDLVFVDPVEGGATYHLKQTPAVNGALVAIEPNSGRVLAMVGGYSFSLSNFNRATQAMRQPGSSFKPFVYASALDDAEARWTPATIIVDGPITLKGAGGATWSPENYEHGYYGPLVFRRGLELSRNAMTVRLAQEVGMEEISRRAIEFGVVDRMDPVLSMALGAGETTPFRLTAAYAAFLNGGRKINPHLIELVQDRDGETLFRSDQRPCPTCNSGFNGNAGPILTPPGTQIIDTITAYQIETMLQGVVQRGTAAAASSLGRPLGGKTGTTNNYRSGWFVGFSPQIVVGVFVGFDDNRTLGSGETGGNVSLPIFIEFMKVALQGLPPLEFQAPPNTEFQTVGPNREAFRPGSLRRQQQRSAAEAALRARLYGTPATPGAPQTPTPGGPPVATPTPAARPPEEMNGLY